VYAQPLQVEAESPEIDDARWDHPESWRPFPVYAEGVWDENPTLMELLTRKLLPQRRHRVSPVRSRS
jgi:hypothetical protein